MNVSRLSFRNTWDGHSVAILGKVGEGRLLLDLEVTLSNAHIPLANFLQRSCDMRGTVSKAQAPAETCPEGIHNLLQ